MVNEFWDCVRDQILNLLHFIVGALKQNVRCTSEFTVTIRTYLFHGVTSSLQVGYWERATFRSRWSFMNKMQGATYLPRRAISFSDGLRDNQALGPFDFFHPCCRDYLYRGPWNLDKPVLLQSLTSPAIGDVHLRLLSVHHSCVLNLTPNSLIPLPEWKTISLSFFSGTFHSAIATETSYRSKISIIDE